MDSCIEVVMKNDETSDYNVNNVNNIVSISKTPIQTGSKHQSPRIEDDPLQYHAKPRDLSKNTITLSKANEQTMENRNISKSANIFSRNSFESLKIDSRLKKLIQDASGGGLGLNTCTFIQNATIPLLLAANPPSVLLKSQTGSGKTLAFVIPILNDLMNRKTPIQRSDGTRALILTPTRELSTQIYNVINTLVKVCVWIIPGCLSGGEKKKSEKARLRKGITILVATPGRLLDHLKSTESFSLKHLQWIVLDEADRLLDMGFEKSILEIFELIRGNADSDVKGEKLTSVNATNLTKRWTQEKSLTAKKSLNANSMCYILASATLSKSVINQLAKPIMSGSSFIVIDADKERVDLISGLSCENDGSGANNNDLQISKKRSVDLMSYDEDEGYKGTTLYASDQSHQNNKKLRGEFEKNEVIEAPTQLSQYFMLVTCKWRLAALLCFLKTHCHQKIVVFLSTCDSVDYHSLLLRETDWPLELDPSAAGNSESDKKTAHDYSIFPTVYSIRSLDSKFYSSMFGKSCPLFRLHGNMAQQRRHEVFQEFAASSVGILLCTDVAARGLDLPQIDWILQYDPPCETSDYVHRIGRTARSGHGGSAVIFLLPSEASYIHLLQSHSLQPLGLSLQSLFIESSKLIPGSLKFKNIDEITAVILQRRLELVVGSNKPLTLAGQQAFRSYIRAYATHSAATKSIFRVSGLHLGHVAKSFGLKDNPPTHGKYEDILARIMNGEISPDDERPGLVRASASSKGSEVSKTLEVDSEKVLSRKEKKFLRDQKYALSKRNKTNQDNSSNYTLGSSSRMTTTSSGSSGRKRLQQKNINLSSDSQKRRLKAAAVASPSGRFRQGGSYFRKKLRSQTTSEFSQ